MVEFFLAVIRIPVEIYDDDRRMRLALRLVSINRFMTGQYFVETRMSLPLMDLSSLRIIQCFESSL